MLASRHVISVSKRQKVSQIGTEYIKTNKYRNGMSFWDFLNAPFLKQLEHLAYLFLKRRNIVGLQEKFVCEEVRIDFSNIEHAIREHVYDVTERTGKRPTMILVGSDIYHELFRNPGFHFYFDQPYRLKVLGISVYLVPWMEGMVAWGDYER